MAKSGRPIRVGAPTRLSLRCFVVGSSSRRGLRGNRRRSGGRRGGVLLARLVAGAAPAERSEAAARDNGGDEDDEADQAAAGEAGVSLLVADACRAGFCSALFLSISIQLCTSIPACRQPITGEQPYTRHLFLLVAALI